MEKVLDQTLAVIQTDLGRIRRYSQGIGEACAAYDRQKVIARQALSDGSALSVTASRLWDRLYGVNTAACQKPQSSASLDPSIAKRAALAAAIKADQAALAAQRRNVCAAAGEISDAPNKESARSRLDDALQSANQVQAIAARLKSSAAELAKLAKPKATSNAGSAGRDKARSEIDAIRNEVEILAGRFAGIDSRFRPARSAMNAAQRRVDALTPGTGEIVDRVRACLRPLAAAPIAREPRRLLEELTQRNNNNFGCRGVVLDSWNVRDLDPPSGTGVQTSTAWRRRSLSLSHSVGQLRGKLAEISGQCQGSEETTVPAVPAPGVEVDIQEVLAGVEDEISQMQTCVAQALSAYNDGWRAEKTVAGPTCDMAGNATTLANLKSAMRDGSASQSQVTDFEAAAILVRTAYARYSLAKATYSVGDIATTKAKLNEAKAAIEALGGAPACAELASKVDRGLARADRLGRVIARARAALGSCDMAELRSFRDSLRGSAHRELRSLSAQADGVLTAQAKLGEASAAYSRGKLDVARARLRRARALLSQVPAGARCTDLVSRIDGGLRRVTKLQGAIRAGERAINTCDIDAINQWKVSLGNTSNPAADDVKGRFNAASRKCKKRERAQRAADRNAQCRKSDGNGYYAGKPDRKGEFYCLPTQRAANAWCNANNNGSGWRAEKISREGGFSCRQNRRQRTADARAQCRQQARDTGQVYAYTKIRRNGTVTCFTCNPGQYWKNGQCRSRTQRSNRPRGGGQQRGGSGALYACTIFNPDGSLLGGGGSTSTIYSPRPVSGLKCTRVR